MSRSVLALVVFLLPVAWSPARAVEPGDILVVDSVLDWLVNVDPVTGDQELLSEGLLFDGPSGLTIDDEGRLFVCDIAGDQILEIDPDTGAQSLVVMDAAFGTLRDIAYEPNTGMLIAVDERVPDQFENEGAVYRINPSTGAFSTLAQGFSIFSMQGVTVAPDGTIYAAVARIGQGFDGYFVVSIDPDDGSVEQITQGDLLLFSNDLVVAPPGTANAGDLFVVDDDGVVQVDPETGDQTQFTIDGFFDRSGRVAWDLDGNLVVTQIFGNSVVRVDPAGTQELVSSGLSGPLLRGVPMGVVVIPAPEVGPSIASFTAALVLVWLRRRQARAKRG